MHHAVHTLPAGTRGSASFIVCYKRSDINRVAVPISRLEQWQASGTSIAELLARLAPSRCTRHIYRPLGNRDVQGREAQPDAMPQSRWRVGLGCREQLGGTL